MLRMNRLLSWRTPLRWLLWGLCLWHSAVAAAQPVNAPHPAAHSAPDNVPDANTPAEVPGAAMLNFLSDFEQLDDAHFELLEAFARQDTLSSEDETQTKGPNQ